VALVAGARRELMLRVHRHRLRREDLEDCYSQAALELVSRALKGATFSSRSHIANTLEQRFVARILDRRRALGGRSPMHAALETAVSIGEAGEQQIAIADARADVEKLVLLRHDLRRLGLVARELTADQRMVLAAQLAGTSRADFCNRFKWSEEKYRKVAQRARARLGRLMSADDQRVPSGGPASEQGDRGTCL
jgi:DNA-directed RNA polymerase specialized sigma24 family protein